ncbi:MAG: bifunctional nuclease family protein [Planctomycetota bacterium]
MSEELIQVEIKKVIGPTPAGAAVLLGNDEKTFVVFIGFYEAAAVIRELKDEKAARPLTHDLIQSVFLGFDVKIKQIVVSDIVDNAFCATLILEQRVNEKNGEWVGRRNEVRIDARPSDCLVLALKNQAEIFVTAEVFSQVQDFSHMVQGDITWSSEGDPLDENLLRPWRGLHGSEEDQEEGEDE